MWDGQKGFGFIVSSDDEELFVNVSDLHPSVQPKILREGQAVKFDIKSDMKGDKAVNVRVAK
jgi:CspA family cold shock protein